MTIDVSFLAAVTLAGLAALLGEVITARSAFLRRYYTPEPLVGGFLVAAGLLLLRVGNVRVQIPTSGYEVDFLVALLTTNMGLHVTPKVLREGYRIFPLFLFGGAVLYFVHLVLVLPLALLWPDTLPAAVLLGPVSFVGAPYNLNPPSQIPPIAGLLAPAAADPAAMAEGMMMLGVLGGSVAAAVLGRRLFRQTGQEPPEASAEERQAPSIPMWELSHHVTYVVVLILSLVVLAFLVQGLLLDTFSWFEEDYLPVIVLSYLFGALFRLLFEAARKRVQFPEEELTIVLLGPTMGLVLTYAVMSIPLHHLQRLSAPAVAAGLLAILGSALLARLAFPLLRRLIEDYYAAVVATVFLAVTTGWGPIAMSFLHRYIGREGRVEPMPVILPLNAFFLFPWLVILLTRLVFLLFGRT